MTNIFYDSHGRAWNDHTRSAAPGATPIPEGQECPTCMRRVPKAKKPSSPQTKVVSFRVPIDMVEEIRGRIEELSKSAGLSSLAYPQARGVMLALLLAESVSPAVLAEVARDMSWGSGSD